MQRGIWGPGFVRRTTAWHARLRPEDYGVACPASPPGDYAEAKQRQALKYRTRLSIAPACPASAVAGLGRSIEQRMLTRASASAEATADKSADKSEGNHAAIPWGQV